MRLTRMQRIAKVIHYLNMMGDERGVGLAEIVTWTNIPRSTVNRYLALMERMEIIHKELITTNKGLTRKWFLSDKPYWMDELPF